MSNEQEKEVIVFENLVEADQGRDNFGKKYKEKRNKLNFGTGSCPWWKFPTGGDSEASMDGFAAKKSCREDSSDASESTVS